MPIIGVLLGLALASKWVAAYAIGALLLLLLVRSALGRVLAIIGLIGITTVLGYMAISVPEGPGLRQPDVPARDDRADAPRGPWSTCSIRSRGRTTSRVRPDRARCPGRPRLLRGAGARQARPQLHDRLALGHAARDRDPDGARLARRVRRVPSRRAVRVRAAGAAPRPRRPRSAPGATAPPPDRLAPPRSPRRPADRLGARLAWSRSRSWSTSSRTSRGR